MTEALHVQPGQPRAGDRDGQRLSGRRAGGAGREVYTVEIVPELAQQATQRLSEMGYTTCRCGRPTATSAGRTMRPTTPSSSPPRPIICLSRWPASSEEGGRLIIPIGPQGAIQTLWLFEKHGGELQATNLGEVSFVPLTGAGHQ